MSADGKDHRPEMAELALKTAKPFASGQRKSASKLDALKSRRAPAGGTPRQGRLQSAYGPAFKFAGELIVGVVVGGGLGWALDKQFRDGTLVDDRPGHPRLCGRPSECRSRRSAGAGTKRAAAKGGAVGQR